MRAKSAPVERARPVSSSGSEVPPGRQQYATAWHMAIWATGIMETATTSTSGTPSRISFSASTA